MYIIKISFIEFPTPENIDIDAKMMIIEQSYAEIWNQTRVLDDFP
jgi:hypothetical protein